MRRELQRGGSYVEFAFLMIFFVPLVLGLISIGMNMHLQLETVQLARDAGHMYARYIDFTLVGNQEVLSAIAGPLGLSTTPGSGNSVVILSTVRYADVSACALAGKVDSNGQPSGCTNYGHWVFAQRVVIGNTGLCASKLGTPSSTIIGSGGKIGVLDQVTSGSAVANITGINGWDATHDTGLPSGQIVYVAEAAATGFYMTPFSTSSVSTYAQFYF